MALVRAGVRVEVRNVDSLLPHEETIPARVELLAGEIERDGVQKDPVIVDARSRTVLDGMHRLAAFSRLGISKIVCSPVDYRSRSIALGRWARTYSRLAAPEVFNTLAGVGVAKKKPIAEALGLLEGGKGGLAAIFGSVALTPDVDIDLRGALEIVRALDHASDVSGWRREFVPSDEVLSHTNYARRLTVLVQKLSKGDVLEAATSGRLFPCKTSMHEVDPRPVAVNLPTTELRKMTGPKPRNRLSGFSPKSLPPNSTYEGRMYKESLLVLNPDD